MSTLDQIVSKAVDRHFQPPNAARAARRQVFIATGTVLVAWAAHTLTGPVAWLLWAWVAYRVHVFVMLFVLGPRLADELARRLNALPPAIRKILAGGDVR